MVNCLDSSTTTRPRENLFIKGSSNRGLFKFTPFLSPQLTDFFFSCSARPPNLMKTGCPPSKLLKVGVIWHPAEHSIGLSFQLKKTRNESALLPFSSIKSVSTNMQMTSSSSTLVCPQTLYFPFVNKYFPLQASSRSSNPYLYALFSIPVDARICTYAPNLMRLCSRLNEYILDDAYYYLNSKGCVVQK